VVGVGDVLAGKYRVEQVLGKGGMGYVVSAIHTQLDQRVAVKFMVPELCEHPEAVARFLREARAAVRIRSEHVARVLDVGTLDDGTPYMVMEFLWGRDLATELEEVRQLPVVQAVDFVLQACEALAEAHAYGIVHRDLKPANLFLTRRADGSALIKVLDFGISKAISDQAATTAESLTASQSLIGSPHYMSPEQVRRPKTVDFRSDIWALGVILHELISGDRPFGGDTPMSVLAAVVSDPAPRLRDVRPELSAGGVESVILRCLEKDPAHRYANVAELALALGPYAPSSAQQLIARIQGITRAQVQSHSVPSGLPGSLGPITPSSTPTTPRSNPPGESGLATLPSPIPLTDPRKGRTATDWGRSGIDRSQRANMKWIFGALALLTAVGCVMYAIGKSRSEPDARVMPEAASAPDAAASTVVLPPWPSLAPTLVEPPPKEPSAPAVTVSSVQAARPATPPVPQHRRTKPRASAAPSGSHKSEGVPSATSGATRPPDPLDERR
jgi:serine/threonine-protein kinase